MTDQVLVIEYEASEALCQRHEEPIHATRRLVVYTPDGIKMAEALVCQKCYTEYRKIFISDEG